MPPPTTRQVHERMPKMTGTRGGGEEDWIGRKRKSSERKARAGKLGFDAARPAT
jgi:hypothetical protein